MMEKLTPSKCQQYKQTQLFGYKGPGEKILEEDKISSLKYDCQGQHLALGDQAGRIIVFKDRNSKNKEQNLEYLTEFQSHMKQFDHLRSTDVEETISTIHWLPHQGKYLKMLTSNSRTIKLWKIYETSDKKVVKSSGRELNMPKLQTTDSYLTSKIQYSFPVKHHASINSIQTTYNQQYLLSSDDYHCLLWSFERPDQPYQLGDIKGDKKVEDVQESINFSAIHPSSDSLFMYGTNKGIIKLCDLRTSSNCDQNATIFKSQYSGNKNFLASLLSSFTSGAFIKQGKYIASRDCLSVKIWDICNNKKPLLTVNLNDGFKSKLSQMFENQAIFDKFTIKASPDGNSIATGSYNNCFHMVDQDSTNTQYELSYKKTTVTRQITGKGQAIAKADYLRKTTAMDFHPLKNTLAVASLNCFFTYSM